MKSTDSVWHKLQNPRVQLCLIIIFTVIGCLALWSGLSDSVTSHNSGTSQTSRSAAAVVDILNTGFSPETLVVHPNTNVTWVNDDAMPHLPAADPYPTHSELPSLVAPRALGQRETYSYLFTRKGIIRYHDDLNPTLTGEIEIQ